MSFLATKWALEQKTGKGVNKIVLIVLADMACDESLTAYPGIDLIRTKAEIDRKTAAKALKDLERLGLIKRKRRPNRSSLYTLIGVPAKDEQAKDQGKTDTSGTTQNGTALGKTDTSGTTQNGTAPIPYMGFSVGPYMGHDPITINPSLNH